MKSEPDRLDFLIVLLPVILIGLLGFQAYEFIQMDRQRAGAVPVSVDEPPPAPDRQQPQPLPQEGEPAAAEPGEVDAQPAAENTDAVADEPGIADSPEGEPEQDAGDTAAAQVDPAPQEAEPAAADADPPAEVAAPPAAADAEPETVIADAQAVIQPTTAGSATPQNAAGQPDAGQPQLLADAAAGGTRPVPVTALADAAPEAPPAGGAEVLVNPQTNPAKVGELLAVDVLVRGASGVGGAIFHLRYDGAMLALNEDPQSELGPFLENADGATRFNATALSNGRVVVSVSLPPDSEGHSGDGRLATFYFQVLAPGETRLDLLQAVLRDANNRPLAAVFSNATLIIVE